MNITFCLLQPGNHPIGGYKVIYEYANRISQKGHNVCIVYDCSRLFYKDKFDFIRILKIHIKYNRNKSWFKLDKRVKLRYALHGINNESITDSDFIIGSAIETIEPIYDLSKKKGIKIYFVQDIENWRYPDEYVNKTYSWPFIKIAISNWIKDRVDRYSKTSTTVINNGLDFSLLRIVTPIAERNPHSVSMLYHALEHKGSKYGLEALIMLKKDIPDLTAEMFGAVEKPTDLPEWINYTKQATAKQVAEIYNKTSVFLCPTINEGFGLTGAESMACGCALVSTEYTGVKEYAVNKVNSLLCDTKNAAALYKNMKILMNDNELRIRLSNQGHKDIQKLDWNISVNKFIDVLINSQGKDI